MTRSASRNTTSFFALIVAAAALLAGRPGGRARPIMRIAPIAIAVVIGCAVGLAVVSLGDHRFIDTVGGAAVRIAVALTATFLLDLPPSRSLFGLACLSRHVRKPGHSAALSKAVVTTAAVDVKTFFETSA